MRGLLLLAAGVLLIVALASAGWVTFSRDDNQATITIDKNEVREDVREVKEKSAQALDEAADAVDSDDRDGPHK